MSGGAGQGQRVDTDDLREFAKRVRGLLKDFAEGASGTKAHGRTGVSRTAFGNFSEALDLKNQYDAMRDTLRDILDGLEAAMDDAQKRADGTADDFEGNDADTAASFTGGASSAASPDALSVPKDVDSAWQ